MEEKTITQSSALKNAKISDKFKAEDFKLCYIDGNIAYFTTKPLSEQWGDDWNDAPFDHNAGTPYEDDGMELVTVAFSSSMETPDEGHTNSPFSVEMINAGAAAWLRTSSWAKTQKLVIPAGASIEQFIDKIELDGGEVYLPATWFAE